MELRYLYIRAWIVHLDCLVSDHFHQPRRSSPPLNHFKQTTKMHFSTLALSTLLSLASARIVGISVPKIIHPGDGFNAIIITENYIQSVSDVAIAFGVAPGAGFPGTLGTALQSYYLGPGMFSSSNLQKYPNFPLSSDSVNIFSSDLPKPSLQTKPSHSQFPLPDQS